MTTRLVNLVADAADPAASAHWYWRAETLGWEVTVEIRHEVAVKPPGDGPGLPLVFVPVRRPRRPWSTGSSTAAPPRPTPRQRALRAVTLLTEVGRSVA